MPDRSPTPTPRPAAAAPRRVRRTSTSGREDRALALGAALLLFAALAVFGARYHWVEEAGSAERDGYVAQAESILAGELPRDPFRPAFYPLAVAGVASLGMPPFDAGRFLANLSAAALAWLAWWFGRRLAGPPAGWAAFVLVAVNPNLWILGQHTTTDMPFAALAAAALAAAFAYLERPGWRAALLAGTFLGLATFTRANALFLVPALGVAWWLGGAAGRRTAGADPSHSRWRWWVPRGRWSHLLAGGAVALLFLAPHFALRAAAFGDPFHDDNWKNLAFKLYGFPDWSYLERVPFAGGREVLAADPGRVVLGFAEELGRFLAGGGISQLLGTPLHGLLLLVGTFLALATWRPLSRSPASPGEDRASGPSDVPPIHRPALRSPAGASRSAGSIAVQAVSPPSPLALRALWLLFAAATFVAAVALTFFTWGRLLLVLLPIGYALSAVPWGSDPALVAVRRRLGAALRVRGRQWMAVLRGRRPAAACRPLPSALARLRKAGGRWLPGGPAAAVLLLLVALLAAKTFLFRLPAFIERHPYAEVAALRALAAEVPPGTVLAGTSPFLDRYLDRPYLYVRDAFGDEVADPALYYSYLHGLLTEAGATHLVTAPTDHRSRPPGLLADEPPVEWLERVPGEEAVRVWRVESGETRPLYNPNER